MALPKLKTPTYELELTSTLGNPTLLDTKSVFVACSSELSSCVNEKKETKSNRKILLAFINSL